MIQTTTQSGESVGDLLVHMLTSHHLAGANILRFLDGKDTVRLMNTCSATRNVCLEILSAQPPLIDLAMEETTPDRYRIPLLTGITQKDVADESLLSWACEYGYLSVAKWLTDNFDIDRNYLSYEIAEGTIENLATLWLTAKCGHFDTVKWIVSKFELTRENALETAKKAFYLSCDHGNEELARWIADAFDIQQMDYVNQKTPFVWACMRGCLELAKWMTDRFGIDKQMVAEEHFAAFNWACDFGRLETAKWLQKRFKITFKDVFDGGNNCIFHNSCYRNDIQMAKWIYFTFNLIDHKPRYILKKLHTSAKIKEQRELAGWLNNEIANSMARELGMF